MSPLAPTYIASRATAIEWFAGDFEDYETDKIRRLDSLNPKQVRYKQPTR
jgi:hypothetical protein